MDEREKVALVTGGGRGIGLACALHLIQDGMRVAVVEINERSFDRARESAGERAASLLLLAGDVTNRSGMSDVVSSIAARWGSVDVLINNAAVNRPGTLSSQSDEDWGAILAVNLTGTFITSAVCAPLMRDHGWGRIVNIGSIGAAGLGASPGYAASKAGLIGLTRQMARELGPDGITVNLVAPGVIETEWVARHLPAENREATAAATPTRRVGTPDDIASIVSFLASEGSRHITGQVISASGGYWMP